MNLPSFRCSALLLAVAVITALVPGNLPAAGNEAADAGKVTDIGSRRELFVDSQLVAETTGDVRIEVQQPEPQEVVLTTGEPWEGNTCAYYTIFRDGDLFRMYYRGSHWDTGKKKATHPEVVCYAESTDGIHWKKPKLGLYEFEGSKDNNIVWNGVGTHCFAVFKDENPKCTPDARYKAISRGRPQASKGLYVFQSPDAIHWKLIQDSPVITTGAFDSQNLAFFDTVAGEYRAYYRGFNNGIRDILTATSPDFLNWKEHGYLTYPDVPAEHLYTNAVRRYERAPHFFIGFPTRYLPKQAQRVEPVFMASRDGQTFHRFTEPVISQEAPEDRKGNRSNYMTWGLVQLPGKDKEYSVYATEAYYTGPDSRVRRFTFRVDGFTALTGGKQGGTLTTKPVRFSGKELQLNYETGKAGKVRVALADAAGKPLPGFSLDDCQPLSGDEIDQTVSWKSGSDPGALAGQPVRVIFEVTDGNLYSWRFQPAARP